MFFGKYLTLISVDNDKQGDEVLHLPTIVEAAESTPAAAKECAYQIRKALSQANAARPYVQYNAVMLTRILSDNPGASFTKNIDKKFVETVKTLIRFGADPSVQQILRETLDNFERDKRADTNLVPLLEMWTKEKVKIERVLSAGVCGPYSELPEHKLTKPQHQSSGRPIFSQGPRDYYPASSRMASNRLPSPEELASRVEEARTSAKLLTQLVQSTPPTELLNHELVREFADRCRAASRSIQAYMNAENPTPDNETMLTLIETSEQLSVAASKHQRSVVQARKTLGVGTAGQGPSPSGSPVASMGRPPHMAPPASATMPPPPPPSRRPVPNAPSNLDQPSNLSTRLPASDNPFRDSEEVQPVVDHNEPYHPGFNPTKSYMGRQDSAINKVSMHAAIPPSSESEERASPNAGQPVADKSPDSAQEQGPIYRY